ncbi:MAG: MFS transporter [Candidatus Binatia bacterium]
MASEHSPALRILFVCLVCIGIGQSMLFSILPPAAREIGLTPFQVSIIFATSASLWVFISPWWGRRSDVRGRRPIILTGLLGYALSMFSLAVVIELGIMHVLSAVVIYPLLIVARSLFAVFGSGTGPASQAYVADRTSRHDRTAGVALVSAAMGVGETIGPGVGAALSAVDLLAPLYLSAALAVLSSFMIRWYLPEDGPPIAHDAPRPPRLSFRDPRVAPFLMVSTALQAVRATTAITLAFFLQDTLGLSAERTVQYSGIGFVTLALAGLFSQLVLVQRFRPSARRMLQTGVPLMLASFVVFVVATTYAAYLVALVLLGLGLGLVRPGSAAGASLAVEANEQGAVAGLVNGIAVLGNVLGPMIATSLYAIRPDAPYLLNAAVMAAVAILLVANRRLRTLRA